MSGTQLAYLDVSPIVAARGTMDLPGSKSISIRCLLLAAMAPGATRLRGVLDSDDTRVMRAALLACGIGIEYDAERPAEHALIVTGVLPFPALNTDIFVGNSGLSARTLLAALAFMGGRYMLHGVPRMHERPIADLVETLLDVGASVRYLGTPGYPPLAIEPPLRSDPGSLRVRGDASSQFLTGLLQAAPLLTHQRGLEISVETELISRPYVAMTIALMKRFGVTVSGDVEAARPVFGVERGASYQSPGEMAVEGDASSASYFLALGALAGGPVVVRGVGRDSIQGDVHFTDVLHRMGASVVVRDDEIEVSSPGVRDGWRLGRFDIDFNHIPDAAMTAAVLALFTDGTSILRNIGSWRVKETDRLAAMATELAKCGALVESGADWLKVTPPEVWRDAVIDTYDDHRMAMCFSLLACAGRSVRINDPECVAKTFPDYFRQLDLLVCPAS